MEKRTRLKKLRRLCDVPLAALRELLHPKMNGDSERRSG